MPGVLGQGFSTGALGQRSSLNCSAMILRKPSATILFIHQWKGRGAQMMKGWEPLLWVFTSGTYRQNYTAEHYGLKFVRARSSCISVSFSSTVDKFDIRWRTGQPSPTTFNVELIHKQFKSEFTFLQMVKPGWNSSSRLLMYFCILPVRGLQLPLRDKQLFPFWHFLTILSFWKMFNLVLETK